MNDPQPTRRRRLPTAALVISGALLGAPMFMSACNIVAPLGYLIGGPPKIPRQYELDPKKVTAVFIDDTRGSVLPTRSVRRKIGEAAERILLNEGKIERVLAATDVMAVADREKYSKQLGIVELGEAINADIIIYVSMEAFSLVQDSANFTPNAAARVRVVDVKEKKQLWPAEVDKSYPLQVTSPPKTGQLPNSLSERSKIQLEFANRVGESIGYLFVERETTPGDGQLDH